ncbi:coilin [Eucyclogobius newberryi]|uniref:coilin n=1 Tax=Eucyclogobius newberryi TaxID=166745 RepID=UPI003B5A1F36
MTDNFIRVRLHFDYAPPAVLGCRMCWLLVDLRSCRVVADLEGIIRDKFELSPGSILSLFIEDCYLPHTESVLVVRDNDCVRVKVDSISKTPKQTSTEAASDDKRKRQRPVEEEETLENGPSLECKKKKRKKSVVASAVMSGVQTETEETHASTRKMKKDKKKQNEERQKSTPPAPVKASPSVKKSVKSTPKIPIHKPQSSSSTSSSSEDEQPAKKFLPPKPVSKPAPVSALASPKTITNGRPPFKKLPRPVSSSSSDTDSSSEEDKTAQAKSTDDKSKSEERAQSTSSVIPNGANDSEEEIELVIKRPVQHPHGRIVVGLAGQQGARLQGAGQQAVRGRGRGKPEPGESWGKGRGRGNCVQYNYHEKEWDRKEASYSTDSLSNVSVVLQNVRSVPKPDYSCMPLLAAPPQVGQKIAFKLLELTDNYTPEVSDYKEAKILNFYPNTKQIELELLTSTQAPSEPGKFDLVYQNADGSESVEYAVDRGSLVMERWDSLLEPRLVI